jgi:hypothetical protein
VGSRLSDTDWAYYLADDTRNDLDGRLARLLRQSDSWLCAVASRGNGSVQLTVHKEIPFCFGWGRGMATASRLADTHTREGHVVSDCSWLMVAMATCPQSRSRPRGGTPPRYRTRLRSCAGSMARATCAARRCSRCSTRKGAGANVRIGQSSCALSILCPNYGGACVIRPFPCRLHILCARVMLDQSPGRRGL